MIEEKAIELAKSYLITNDFPQLIEWFTVNRVDMLKAGCVSVNGDEETLIPGIAAVCCVHMGIKIIDDLIDEDLRGIQKKIGVGQAANAAYIYQATGYQIITESNLTLEIKLKVLESLLHFAKITSIGQYYDAVYVQNKKDYFHALSLKSGPLFGDCMRIGGLLNDASKIETNTLYQLGVYYGYLIQLNDDLSDIFALPASNDWLPNRNNLPLIYASENNHPKQKRFLEIRNLTLQSNEFLEEAQQIIISSGSYLNVIEDIIWQAHIFQQLLNESDLKNKQPLQGLLVELISPIQYKINSFDLSFSYQELVNWVIKTRRNKS